MFNDDFDEQLQDFMSFRDLADAKFGFNRWSLTASMLGSALKVTMTVFLADGKEHSQFVIVNAHQFKVQMVDVNGKLEEKTDWEHAGRAGVALLAVLFDMVAVGSASNDNIQLPLSVAYGASSPQGASQEQNAQLVAL